MSGFPVERGEPGTRAFFRDFLKNLGLAGGPLLAVPGTHPAPIGRFTAHPLGSTSIYAPLQAADSHGRE